MAAQEAKGISFVNRDDVAGLIWGVSSRQFSRFLSRLSLSECQNPPFEARPLCAAVSLIPSYPLSLSLKARHSLSKLGVTTRLNTRVLDIGKNTVVIGNGSETETLSAGAIFWTAGIKASSLGSILSTRTGVALDNLGRVIVEKDLTLPAHPEIMVIGDLANFSHQTGAPLPGVAPVAIQQGKYVARSIRNRLLGKETPPFRYEDKGNLAVIGRNSAVADFGFLKVSGYLAWILWVFVHIWYLIGFDNKFSVLIRWAWDYLTRKRGARLIVGDENRGDPKGSFP